MGVLMAFCTVGDRTDSPAYRYRSGEECVKSLPFLAGLSLVSTISTIASLDVGDQVPRRDLALVLTLEGAGLPVEGALDPDRALDQLDMLLHYHSLEYLDSLILEIPALKGGEVR